jgi:hypothetical protein
MDSRQTLGEILRERERRLLRTAGYRFAAVTALLGALITASGLLFSTFDEKKRQVDIYTHEIKSRQDQVELLDQMNGMAKAIATDQAEIQRLATLVDALAKGKRTPPSIGLMTEERRSLNQLLVNQTQLSNRMSALEGALINSPEKALALPLMKQQLVDTQDRVRSDIDGMRAEFGRLFTTVQWALGLIITVILGLAGLIIKKPGERLLSPSEEKQASPTNIAK